MFLRFGVTPHWKPCSMAGAGLLQADRYHTSKACQDGLILDRDLTEGEFSSIRSVPRDATNLDQPSDSQFVGDQNRSIVLLIYRKMIPSCSRLSRV